MKEERKKDFTDKEKRQILALRSIGVPFREIAERLGASESFVRKNYKTWTGEN